MKLCRKKIEIRQKTRRGTKTVKMGQRTKKMRSLMKLFKVFFCVKNSFVLPMGGPSKISGRKRTVSTTPADAQRIV